MSKELLVLLSVTSLLLSAASKGAASNQAACPEELAGLLLEDIIYHALGPQGGCLQADQVQVAVYGQGDTMEARVLTLGNHGLGFRTIQQTTQDSLFYLVSMPPTHLDLRPWFLMLSTDMQSVLQVDRDGAVTMTAVCSDTYWDLEADYQFSLRGSMDHAQLVSSQGVVGVTPQGAMKVGGANSRYHVRIISSVEKCYPGGEETKDDTKTTQ